MSLSKPSLNSPVSKVRSHLSSVHKHNLFLLAHSPCLGRAHPSNQPLAPSSWPHSFLSSFYIHSSLLPDPRDEAMPSHHHAEEIASCHVCYLPEHICSWLSSPLLLMCTATLAGPEGAELWRLRNNHKYLCMWGQTCSGRQQTWQDAVSPL